MILIPIIWKAFLRSISICIALWPLQSSQPWRKRPRRIYKTLKTELMISLQASPASQRKQNKQWKKRWQKTPPHLLHTQGALISIIVCIAHIHGSFRIGRICFSSEHPPTRHLHRCNIHHHFHLTTSPVGVNYSTQFPCKPLLHFPAGAPQAILLLTVQLSGRLSPSRRAPARCLPSSPHH